MNDDQRKLVLEWNRADIADEPRIRGQLGRFTWMNSSA